MRYPSEHKSQTRARILAEARAAFRAEGLGLGVKALMNRVGLTQGAFYAHFPSKAELVGEAVGEAMAGTTAAIRAAAEAAPPGGAVAAVLAYYLSPGHRRHPEVGCAVAALAGELAREEAAARGPAWGGVEGLVAALAPYMAGADAAERRSRALALASAMVGGLAAARLAPDDEAADALLADLRATLGRAFG